MPPFIYLWPSAGLVSLHPLQSKSASKMPTLYFGLLGYIGLAFVTLQCLVDIRSAVALA